MGRLKYLLDTNVCIHFLKNDVNVVEKFKEVGLENCYISEITILEFSYGVAKSNPMKMTENRAKFKQFVDNLDGRVLVIRPAFEEFSTQKVRLRKLGTLISDFNLLIGCTAVVNNLTLASRNIKEMNRIEELKLENWID